MFIAGGAGHSSCLRRGLRRPPPQLVGESFVGLVGCIAMDARDEDLEEDGHRMCRLPVAARGSEGPPAFLASRGKHGRRC